MKKWRVNAESISDCYVIVEAETEEEAVEIAHSMDGGDFIPEDSGDFVVSNYATEVSNENQS